MAEPKESYVVYEPQATDPKEAIRDLVRQINEQNQRMAEAFSEAFVHGGISVNNNTTATTIATQNVEYQFAEFDTNSPSNGMTPDYTQNHITIGSDGTYFICCVATSESPGAGAFVLDHKVKKNNGATALENIHVHRDLAGGAGETGSVGMCGVVTLSKGDTIELWVENESSTNNPTLEDAVIGIVKLSNEAI